MTVVGKDVSGKEPVVIMDLGAPNTYANFITEVAEDNGIVRVGFAALCKSGDGQTIAMTVVRLHIKRDVAWEMCRRMRSIEEALAKGEKR
jgi:hypothetical protein